MIQTLWQIVGDAVGSKYEFYAAWNEGKVPPKLNKEDIVIDDSMSITDDTIMTIAVANAIWKLSYQNRENETPWNNEEFKQLLIEEMVNLVKQTPEAGYGPRFYQWAMTEDHLPYNSFGNGSAMRVSPVAYHVYYNDGTLDDVMEMAKVTAEVTHNHPEGIKGAQAIASAIYLLLKGETKDSVKEFIVEKFGYDLDKTLEEISDPFQNNVSCQISVPQAFIAFFSSDDYEQIIANAINIGGDTDTVASMAGALIDGENYYKGVISDFGISVSGTGIMILWFEKFEKKVNQYWGKIEKCSFIFLYSNPYGTTGPDVLNSFRRPRIKE